jgi:hypothetical protein
MTAVTFGRPGPYVQLTYNVGPSIERCGRTVDDLVGRADDGSTRETRDVIRTKRQLLVLTMTALVVVGCARQNVASAPAATTTPAATSAASTPSTAGSAASPAATLQPLPSFDLGDLTAVDKALAGANAALSAANNAGSEGGSR